MSFLNLLQQPGLEGAPALAYEHETLSRGELVDRATALADRLTHAGVGPRSKVIVSLPNSPAFLLSLIAVNQCGAVFMPVNPGLSPDERRRIDEMARPDAVIAEKGPFELLPGACLSQAGGPERASDRWDDEGLSDVAAIIFTSGTTGTPKGVMMTEAALLTNARAVAGYLALSE